MQLELDTNRILQHTRGSLRIKGLGGGKHKRKKMCSLCQELIGSTVILRSARQSNFYISPFQMLETSLNSGFLHHVYRSPGFGGAWGCRQRVL